MDCDVLHKYVVICEFYGRAKLGPQEALMFNYLDAPQSSWLLPKPLASPYSQQTLVQVYTLQ